MDLLCRIGIHIEKFLTCNVAGGSRCSCGKKSTPPIIWPRREEARQEAPDLENASEGERRGEKRRCLGVPGIGVPVGKRDRVGGKFRAPALREQAAEGAGDRP